MNRKRYYENNHRVRSLGPTRSGDRATLQEFRMGRLVVRMDLGAPIGGAAVKAVNL